MQIPGPDTRVVELRVHGILGTTGDALTDSVASVDVAGDGVGRIVQPADRLRRPVPGPMLSAGDRTVPRVVEGYVWGGMTSGGAAKATWALLFPFALANMAHWMLPPTRPGSHTSRLLTSALRSLLRLSALLLTLLFVAQLTVVSLDLVAAQCLSPTRECMGFVPEGFRTVDLLRASLALLPIGLVVLLMHRLSSVSWQVSASAKETGKPSARAPMLPGANVVADPDTPALRTLHVVGALSVVVLLALGGPFPEALDPRWVGASVLLGIALIATTVLDDPSDMWGTSSSLVLRAALGVNVRRTLVSLSALLVASVAVFPPQLTGPLPGSGTTIDALTSLLLVTCVAVAVLLLPAALLARPAWAKLAPQLRPWAGGWMAAPTLLIASLLGGGFGAGLAFGLRQALGAPGLELPLAYDDVTIFWGTATVLTAIAAVLVVPYVLFDRWRAKLTENDVPSEVALLHAGRQEDQRSAAKAWRWADLQRLRSHQALLIAAGVLAASTALALLARFAGLPKSSWDWLSAVGVTALVALAIGLLRLVYLAAKQPQAARYVGILCDLTLFWPREAHPVVPPCYALKVIPELAARAAEHLEDPNTRVVLVGHSQGSLLAAVAAARLLDSLPENDRERVGLVTAGSQLQWAYPRAFPGVVPHDALGELAGSLNGRWRSLCRGTDPIGGAVSTWNRQVYDGMLIGVGFKADGTEGPLSAAVRGPTGALVLGGDHWLPDPQRGPFSFRRWLPGVLGHTEYSCDPEWDRAVAMAAGLEIPVRGATLPLRTPAAAPLGATAAMQPQGSDGMELPDSDAAWDSELSEVLAEAEQSETPESKPTEDATQRWNEQEKARPIPLEVPEITEPRGRTAPWERGISLRAAER